MSNPVIKVENLGKQYRLGQVGTGTLAHDFNSWWHRVRGKEDPNLKIGAVNDRTAKSGLADLVWALRDINFEVQQGEVLGIIGKNGAGKSTLLKILSKVTTPTVGSVKIKGRIASLLEVGTGFHPDLSGRENIFLNGAILGMTKTEIRSKFDEIVAFSGVERYIDTPVKRYSSGMYVRLAFAVAAHLEPEILIIDEVLAVGDAEFQKKCLGKMKDVAGQGRTVLFVSHNMAAIQNLCSTCMYLSKGQIKYLGETQDVINSYLSETSEVAQIALLDRKDRTGNGYVRFEYFNLKNEEGDIVPAFQSGKAGSFSIGISINETESNRNLRVAVGINNNFGHRIAFFDNELTDQIFREMGGGKCIVEIKIPKIPFDRGLYTVTLFAKVNGEISDWVQDAGTFMVEGGDFFQTGRVPESPQGIFIEHFYSLSLQK
jgi:lipopolysaccharide transport system ATP-binding protein